MNEWNPIDYNTGYADGRNSVESDKASTALMFSVFSLFGNIALLFLLFCPRISIAWAILEKYRFSGKLKGWNYFWTMIGIILVLELLVVLFKAFSNRLKARGSMLWLLPWLVCFLYSFVLPALLIHEFVFEMFRPAPGHSTDTLSIVAWVIGLVVGRLIYMRTERQFRVMFRRYN